MLTGIIEAASYYRIRQALRRLNIEFSYVKISFHIQSGRGAGGSYSPADVIIVCHPLARSRVWKRGGRRGWQLYRHLELFRTARRAAHTPPEVSSLPSLWSLLYLNTFFLTNLTKRCQGSGIQESVSSDPSEPGSDPPCWLPWETSLEPFCRRNLELLRSYVNIKYNIWGSEERYNKTSNIDQY